MKSFLPDKLYDVLVWIALVALDAVGVFYKTISMIWHLPYGEEVLATCAAVSLLLGILLGVSKAQYNKNANADIKQIQKEYMEEIEQKQTTFNIDVLPNIVSRGEVENVQDQTERTDSVE